ncbi:MAG: SIMPL domain-containing protein [Candidatus Micrarchaeia archaeon]
MGNKECSGNVYCNNALISFGIITAVALLGFVIGMYLAIPQQGVTGNITLTSPSEHTISVNGEAQQKVTPDLLVISLSVETQEDSAALSQEKNAEIMDNVKKALLSRGILEKDISTSSYSVYPVEQSHWICPKYRPGCTDDEKIYETKVIGYRTVHIISAKTGDLTGGGALVDAAVQAGATNVNSVVFTLKDETRKSIEESLLKYASANAKGKAQKIADGLGVRLGAPASAGSSYVYFPGPVYKNYASYAMDSAVPTSFSPGEMVVTASVSVSYLIE